MSWMQMLEQTYENCRPLIGQAETEDAPLLLPIAHTTQNAHIELQIDSSGNLNMARVITDKKDSVTIIPCTEESESRAGTKPIHHPLFDKLQYLAGDYTAYGGEKGDSFHQAYMQDLEAWCASPHAHPRVQAVLNYLKKGCLIRDLVETGILPVDQNGRLIRKWNREYGEKRGIFTAASPLSDPLDAFVRIDVHEPFAEQPPLWNDPTLWERYIDYYLSRQQDMDLCYVTGETMPCSDMSPSKIRNSGDKAKLISSNDTSGFTFRGRFESAKQVARVGYTTTQKAHNALKWLISKQGFRNGDQVFVIWGTHNEPIPPIEKDSLDMQLEAFGEQPLPDVHTEYAQRVNQMMAGYAQHLTPRSQVVIMGLDSATTGRMSIIRYQELWGSDFLERLQNWYQSCVWVLDYKSGGPYGSNPVGTPSPKDLLFAIYGKQVVMDIDNKLRRTAMQRLMHCILEGAPIPIDFMQAAARRASNPNALEDWEYRKTLAVACAIIRKHFEEKGERYTVGLDYENRSRSYLLGRVLAYYHYIEQRALTMSNEKRPTNALRLKYQFSRRPAQTLLILDQKIQPYLTKSDGRLNYLVDELNQLMSQLDGNQCENLSNQPLDPTYLLGFSSQLTALQTGKKGE